MVLKSPFETTDRIVGSRRVQNRGKDSEEERQEICSCLGEVKHFYFEIIKWEQTHLYSQIHKSKCAGIVTRACNPSCFGSWEGRPPESRSSRLNWGPGSKYITPQHLSMCRIFGNKNIVVVHKELGPIMDRVYDSGFKRVSESWKVPTTTLEHHRHPRMTTHWMCARPGCDWIDLTSAGSYTHSRWYPILAYHNKWPCYS